LHPAVRAGGERPGHSFDDGSQPGFPQRQRPYELVRERRHDPAAAVAPFEEVCGPERSFPEEIEDKRIDIGPLEAEERALGDRGIVMVDTEDPLCAAASLLSMEDYTVMAFTEPALFHRLLEKMARRIHDRTAEVSRQFPGRLTSAKPLAGYQRQGFSGIDQQSSPGNSSRSPHGRL